MAVCVWSTTLNRLPAGPPSVLFWKISSCLSQVSRAEEGRPADGCKGCEKQQQRRRRPYRTAHGAPLVQPSAPQRVGAQPHLLGGGPLLERRRQAQHPLQSKRSQVVQQVSQRAQHQRWQSPHRRQRSRRRRCSRRRRAALGCRRGAGSRTATTGGPPLVKGFYRRQRGVGGGVGGGGGPLQPRLNSQSVPQVLQQAPGLGRGGLRQQQLCRGGKQKLALQRLAHQAVPARMGDSGRGGGRCEQVLLSCGMRTDEPATKQQRSGSSQRAAQRSAAQRLTAHLNCACITAPVLGSTATSPSSTACAPPPCAASSTHATSHWLPPPTSSARRRERRRAARTPPPPLPPPPSSSSSDSRPPSSPACGTAGKRELAR